jgi:3-oxoadipate enol-lactonase
MDEGRDSMATVSSAGTNIYYEDAGEGEAIVFAHGAGGNAAIWFEQVAAFRDRYRCLTFDHRRFARSPAPPETLTVPQFRDDVLALLDHLDIESAHLVGQSMGGFTALRLALDVPERVKTLTLSATSGGLPNPAPSDAMRSLTSSRGRGTGGVIATMARRTAADPVRLALYEAINAFNTEFSWEYLRGLRGPALEDLDAVRAPVLFIAGAEDPLFPQALLESYVPHFADARIEVVEDAGHSPYFEQPAVFNRLLGEFLERGNG